jgi:iron complex transport system substrate-binding protein
MGQFCGGKVRECSGDKAVGFCGNIYQRSQFFRVILLLAGFMLVSCDREKAPVVVSAAKHPTVASMVPAATDILISMGARDHLIAVSNYDTTNPSVGDLPRVGDYQTTDWEKLGALKPDVIVIQMNEASVPEGLKSRAADLGAKLVNVHINTLADIESAMTQLGEAAGEAEKAAAARSQLEARLARVKQLAGDEKIPAMMVLDDSGKTVAGPGGFLDDVLTLAGGRNVAAELGKRYGTIDAERIAAMNPSVIIEILPSYPAAQLAQTDRAWESLPNVDAVKNHRLYIITDWYALLPSPHVADVAEQVEKLLHSATTKSAR